ncbi:MAG TPA: tetratricopeptide repeat protein [Chthoniobacterales bacterium]|nr:tetratricopeptide repeat protein [Chthoniobacterales bacterium]
MKTAQSAAGFLAACLLLLTPSARSQQEVRRAQPVDETPPPEAEASASPMDTQALERRQLEYANALFTRKIYDLAIPEYQKYLDDYPGASGRANAYFSLGECYRNLSKLSNARTSFQRVLNDYGESDFAGPAAYALGEMAFTQKDYRTALPLFHLSAAKSKDAGVALSGRYFEARCLEALGQKDEACDIYQQVAEAKNPNPYREDARMTAGSIALARGRKSDALRQYEALSNETQKPALKAEATIRAGLIAVDLEQTDAGKIDKAMSDKAMTLLQKGKSLPEAGRWRAPAQVGILRSEFQTGQYQQVVSDYKKIQLQVPEEARPEVMLLAANSERQLGHTEQAEAIYRDIIEKYPNREEARDAGYQRLINIYNSDPSALPPEVDNFLASNPTPERADQAKLLKAEALYKQQNYPRAAPIYAELRASQLPTKLRIEASLKLGLCSVQMKDNAGIIEAFSYFVQAFPDSPQAPFAYTQRALAYEENKNYEAELSDLNTILTKYPGAHEREAALQQKALILGEQQNPRGMVETFRQLLKEFPKTPVAAQAHFFIGKATFDAKNYKMALRELDIARQLNKDKYQKTATTLILSSYFALRDRKALSTEVDNFLAAFPDAVVAPGILQWLGIEYYNDKDFAGAEKYLSALGQMDNPPDIKPDFWFYLGDAAAKLQKFDESEKAFGKYVQLTTDPAGKAKALLKLGDVKIAAHKPDDAQLIAEQIIALQPEGQVNAAARILAGDVQFERGNFEDAGKAFMGVALLYDDPAITPRALQKAAAAYQKAGNTEEANRLTKQLKEKYPNYAGS